MAGRGKRDPSDRDRRPARAPAAKSAAIQQGRELERLTELERTIGTPPPVFFEVGQALIEVNEQRLYRVLGYDTFAEYIAQRWGISRGYAYRKIAAARVVEILRKARVGHLPTNEAQARELAPLAGDPDALRDAWLAALEESATSGLTAAAIRAAVARRSLAR